MRNHGYEDGRYHYMEAVVLADTLQADKGSCKKGGGSIWYA